MEVELQKYNLPDLPLLEGRSTHPFIIWQPQELVLVLGRANNIEDSLEIERVVEDGVKVIKRATGGESVLLSPKMVLFSTKFKKSREIKNREYFDRINSALIAQLSKLKIEGIAPRGISDLSIWERKIMGSSMSFSNGELFYHAVLNVEEQLELFSRYLKHPAREPQYREGRNHGDFITSLYGEGYSHISYAQLKSAIREALTHFLIT